MFAQGIDINEIAKRTGSTREYVMTVTYKLRMAAEQKVQNETEISDALYRTAFEKETGIAAVSESEPAVAEASKPKIDYHKDRVSRTSERFTENLILLHTRFRNPDSMHSTWRYEYRSPVTNGKRSKFLGTLQNMSHTQARNLVTRYNKIVLNGKDPFPVGVRAVGWVNAKKNAVPVADAPAIVVPHPAVERDEPKAAVVEEPVFIPPFLKEEPVFRNKDEYLAYKGDHQLIKPVPLEISEPVKTRAKRVVKPKPLPEPNLTMWGRVKAKLRGWLA
jgi:hypothetical protein